MLGDSILSWHGQSDAGSWHEQPVTGTNMANSPTGVPLPGHSILSQHLQSDAESWHEQHAAETEPAYSMVFESDASSITSAAGLQEVRNIQTCVNFQWLAICET